MNFFEEVLEDPKGLQEELFGPSYDYTANIKTPSEMGMSSSGSLSVLAKDIEGLIAYIELLVAGTGNASKTGKPLGNQFFFKTNATCKDVNSDGIVNRYMYINNIPDGSIPFISSAMGVQFTEMEGLIPGTMGNLAAINPLAIFQAFQMGSQPQCREITMPTTDTNNVRSTETQFVADTDIANIPACDFTSKKNPVTKETCREAFTNIGNYDYSKIPNDPFVKLFYFSLILIGFYILILAMYRSQNKKMPKNLFNIMCIGFFAFMIIFLIWENKMN